MPVLTAIFWKFLLFPFWIAHVVTRPKIRVKYVNPRIHFFRRSSSFDRFCLRTRIQFIFYSLARVIVLNETRINRTGPDWQILRNELNKARALGYRTKLYEAEAAISFLDELFLKYQRRDFRNESGFSGNLEGVHLIVCVGINKEGDIAVVSAAWVSESYARLFYYFSTEKHHIRWLVTEELIQTAYKLGVRIFQTDNLLDTSTGSYIFQQKCGYQTVRLRFH